ncbi:hypothetical protein GCM10008018_15130 [Paenibacillus marchantiophytorum]|uniref:Uncharacterized protein n=1 Tax=Paenibacillus marchantiophytorum TaxID=1619310 RepID=A0ABQ2BRS3_9BACL|nr:hypothetical protein [Paenibacillus marchantiophytorum]GGI46039.1 hypothetical protein GCM10008018_15130 [Paenibacillus marchantiophytorum]
MSKFVRLTLIFLLFSAIMFPAYASASTGSNHSLSNKKSAAQTIKQLFSYFSNKKVVEKDVEDFLKKNPKFYNDIKWNDKDCPDSFDIWKKWFCY